jgi:hypothetical protein
MPFLYTLIWVLFSFILCGVAYFNFEAGFFTLVWNADASGLSFVIMALFTFAHIMVGKAIFTSDNNYCRVDERSLDVPYEISEVCMKLGLLGTVFGFILMTASFTTVDFSQVENIKQLFTLATNGMSTALFTTFFGLAANIVIRAQCFLAGRID